MDEAILRVIEHLLKTSDVNEYYSLPSIRIESFQSEKMSDPNYVPQYSAWVYRDDKKGVVLGGHFSDRVTNVSKSN